MKQLLLQFLEFQSKDSFLNRLLLKTARQKVWEFLENRKDVFPKEVLDINIAMGVILLQDLGIDTKTTLSYHWEVTEVSRHCYSINGVHPVLLRIDKYNIRYYR